MPIGGSGNNNGSKDGDLTSSLQPHSNRGGKNMTPELRERLKFEMNLSTQFLNLIRQKLEDIQGTPTAQENFRLEPKEREVLLNINNLGMLESIAAGMFALTVLRTSRNYLRRRLYGMYNNGNNRNMQERFQSSPPRSSTPPTGPTSSMPNSPFHANNRNPSSSLLSQPGSLSPRSHPSQQQQNGGVPREGWFSYVFGWTVDAFAALTVSAMTSFMVTNVENILGRLSDIPLVAGKSTVSREICPDVVALVQRWENELQQNDQERHMNDGTESTLGLDDSFSSDADTTTTGTVQTSSHQRLLQQSLYDPQAPNFKALLEFARNCDRRRQYEEQLRQEKGVISPFYQVDVPEPGVPTTLAPSILGMKSGAVNDDGMLNENVNQFYDPSSNSSSGTAW